MIEPNTLFFGTISFSISFLTHVIVWRIFKPVKYLFCLFFIFIILPSLIYFLFGRFSHVELNCKDAIFVLICHFGLSGAYIMSYPAIAAECPTLKIILAVRASMPKGMTFEAINDIFCEDKLLSARFDDLINDNLIYFKDGKWAVSLKGRLLVILFSLYRQWLNLPLGEG